MIEQILIEMADDRDEQDEKGRMMDLSLHPHEFFRSPPGQRSNSARCRFPRPTCTGGRSQGFAA